MSVVRERLQKLLSRAGVASRRHAEVLIGQGRVCVNGRIARCGDRADPGSDSIAVDGALIGFAAERLTLLLNKPRGVVCSCHDPEGRRTVLELLPPELARGTGVHPVGRLDVDSQGALLLTNDGTLTLALTHPRYGHSKRYQVLVRGLPGEDTLQHWRQGVLLDGSPTRPAQIRCLECRQGDALLEITLREGRNRQIRRVAEQLGHPVLRLRRTAIAGIGLGSLPSGAWRQLQPPEIVRLSRGAAR
ncbi:MAG: rRNA pseudouridine synthase [Aphanocapsa feldmannii 288cV]|nr:MAG: rRNA pseudouridine synthase [Aphanocapsa feldmannii 288cV]